MNATSVDSAVQADGSCNALQSAVFFDTQRCGTQLHTIASTRFRTQVFS